MKPRNRVKDHQKTFKEQHPPKSQARDLKLAGELFLEWKRQLMARPIARQDLPQAVEKLKQQIAGAVHDVTNIEQTLKMLDEMKVRTEAALICQSNYIEEPPKKGVKPKRAAFRNRAEFEALSFIQKFMEADGYDGMFLTNHYLYADYRNKEAPALIGVVDNLIGIEHIPQMAEHFLKIKQRDEPKPENN